MRRPTSTSLFLLALAAVAAAVPNPAAAQEGEAAAGPPPVTVESITVEPSAPGPDTLCKLTVRLQNSGDQTASQLGFDVSINGQPLAVYGNQLFMYPLPAGGAEELKLYNFWSTETGRPMPASGKLELEVTLREAVWYTIADDEEGVEVWTPQGDVPGLPSSKTITLEMAKAKSE